MRVFLTMDFDDIFRSIKMEDVYFLSDIILSDQVEELFNIHFDTADLRSLKNDAFISDIEYNTLKFFKDYNPSNVPTDEEYKPTSHDHTLVFELLSTYVKGIVSFFHSQVLPDLFGDSYFEVKLRVVRYTPPYSCQMKFELSSLDPIQRYSDEKDP